MKELQNPVSMSTPLLKQKLLELKSKDNYASITLSDTGKHFDRLCDFMGNNEIYTADVGKAYLDHISTKGYSAPYVRTLKRLIYVLDCLISDKPVNTRRSKAAISVGGGFEAVYNRYIATCKEDGNAKNTVAHKGKYAARFVNNLEACGCKSPSEITPALVTKACLISPVKGCHKHYRSFLRYLKSEGLVPFDYTPLVPHSYASQCLPDVYTKEELMTLEAVYDRNTAMGKRDYALVTLMTRLNLRPSDIAKLTFDELSLEGVGALCITQQKSKQPLKLPLVPEVKEAIIDYLTVRPESDSPYVFLKSHAPVTRLTSTAVSSVVSKGFERAGVEPDGREHGARALRSSGATHKVNSGVSYEVVSKSLGHTSKNTLRYYAAIDISNLRKCAQNPPPPTEGSYFDRFLKGEVVLK